MNNPLTPAEPCRCSPRGYPGHVCVPFTPAELAVAAAVPDPNGGTQLYDSEIRAIVAKVRPALYREAATYLDLELREPTGCDQCEDPVEALLVRAAELEGRTDAE